jgi:hypothetical protein
MGELLCGYLGRPSDAILRDQPFNSWTFERTPNEEVPIFGINYVCRPHGIEFSCDDDERIHTIFMHVGRVDERLLDVPPDLGRSGLENYFGPASRFGGQRLYPVLGVKGAWVRFDRNHYSIHVEFEPDEDRIRKLTLMRADVAP